MSIWLSACLMSIYLFMHNIAQSHALGLENLKKLQEWWGNKLQYAWENTIVGDQEMLLGILGGCYWLIVSKLFELIYLIAWFGNVTKLMPIILLITISDQYILRWPLDKSICFLTWGRSWAQTILVIQSTNVMKAYRDFRFVWRVCQFHAHYLST